MIKAGIIGATGYAGNEIVRLLLGHKDVEIKWFGSRSYIDQQYADIYQNFFRLVDAKCMDDNMAALADEVDVIFTATPQGLCASLINEEILSKCKVIDLSADFRIKDVKKYEKWYGIEHKAPQFIEEAVYGLCEINREDIKNARLIANPGCYPTCSTLSIYPLLKEGLIDPNTIIIMTTNLDYVGCGNFNQSVLSRMSLIQPKQELTEEKMKQRITARTGYADENVLRFMISVVKKIHAYLKEEDLQDGVCGYRELENWVLTFRAIKDIRRAAQIAVLSKAAMDPEEQEHLMKTYIEPYYSKQE